MTSQNTANDPPVLKSKTGLTRPVCHSCERPQYRCVCAARARQALAVPQRPGRCCAGAATIDCVCRGAWVCPEHGETHRGTHD